MPFHFIASVTVAATGLSVLLMGIRGDQRRRQAALHEQIDREWLKLSQQREKYL